MTVSCISELKRFQFRLYFSSGMSSLMQPFKISERTHTAFREDAERRYVASVVAFLKKNFPELAEEEPETLTGFVTAMVNKAKGYGLSTKRDAAFYVITARLLGQDFDEKHERASRVLASSLSGPEKADLLQRVTVEHLDSAGRTQK
jgi:hypothetical protein